MKVVRLNPCAVRLGPSPIGYAVHFFILLICAVITISDIPYLSFVSFIMVCIISLTLPIHAIKMAGGYTLSVRQARYLVYQSSRIKISLLISQTNYSISENLVTLSDGMENVFIYFEDEDEIEELKEFLYEVFNL